MTTTATQRLYKDPAHAQFIDFSWPSTASPVVGNYWDGCAYVVGAATFNTPTPAPALDPALKKIHGSQLNIRGDGGLSGGVYKQGFDERDPAPSVVTFDNTKYKSFPLALAVGDVLVSSSSHDFTTLPLEVFQGSTVTIGGARSGLPYFDGDGIRSVIDGYGALFCVAVAPGVDDLRPAYGGNPAARFGVGLSMVTVRANMVKLPTNVFAPPHTPSAARLIEFFKRPMIEAHQGWYVRYLEGANNSPGYGQYWAELVGQACLKICEQPDGVTMTIQQREDLIRCIVQLGIDIWGMFKDGRGYTANGGHMHGRKAAMMVAAVLLNDANMLNAFGVVGTGVGHHFTEDECYWANDTLYLRDHAGSPAMVGHNTTNQNGRGYQQWTPQMFTGPGDNDIDHIVSYGMQSLGASHVGMMLAMAMMGLYQAWDYQVAGTNGNNTMIPLAASGTAPTAATATLYSAWKAFARYIMRFMCPMPIALRNEYLGVGAGPGSTVARLPLTSPPRYSGVDAASLNYWATTTCLAKTGPIVGGNYTPVGVYAQEMWDLYAPTFLCASWVLYGTDRGVGVDRTMPILLTQDIPFPYATNSVLLECWNCPTEGVVAIFLGKSSIMTAPATIVQSGGVNYYNWLSTDVVWTQLTETVNAYGYLSRQFSMRTDGTDQHPGSMLQIAFQMKDGSTRYTWGMATNGTLP